MNLSTKNESSLVGLHGTTDTQGPGYLSLFKGFTPM